MDRKKCGVQMGAPVRPSPLSWLIDKTRSPVQYRKEGISVSEPGAADVGRARRAGGRLSATGSHGLVFGLALEWDSEWRGRVLGKSSVHAAAEVGCSGSATTPHMARRALAMSTHHSSFTTHQRGRRRCHGRASMPFTCQSAQRDRVLSVTRAPAVTSAAGSPRSPSSQAFS